MIRVHLESATFPDESIERSVWLVSLQSHDIPIIHIRVCVYVCVLCTYICRNIDIIHIIHICVYLNK